MSRSTDKTQSQQTSLDIVDFLAYFVLLDDLLEVSESLRCVVEYLALFDTLSDNFIKDDLKPH